MPGILRTDTEIPGPPAPVRSGADPVRLADEHAHRAVGVVYHPGAGRWGDCVPTVLGRRYDAFC